MKITIWDLDYYYAKKKQNCFNVTAMKISSYHQQLGDQINFVTSEYDIRRPYDIFYIIKEKNKTPHPPADLFLNPKVRFIGKAFQFRAWKIPDVIMAVRPDYLLYPEKNTRLERSEYLQLFNTKGELLPQIQNYTNSFKGKKRVVLTDKYMWYASKKSIIQALNMLSEVKNLSFFEPIWIQKLYQDEELKKEFFKLKLTPGAQLNWQPIDWKDFPQAFQFLLEVKQTWPTVAVGSLEIKLSNLQHWDSWLAAYRDFNTIKSYIIQTKKEGILLKIIPLNQRMESPYFFLFEEIIKWTQSPRNNLSWLEYLMGEYKMYNKLNQPQLWNELFRDLLRQTYTDHEFLLLRRKDNYMNKNEIPWVLWEEEFKYGI